jgi:hypothetical protein
MVNIQQMLKVKRDKEREIKWMETGSQSLLV